ncbi:MAG: VWA domain-containing protein [Candidatus Muirbacterium halophilum]|nr:VWA domain-containing protein [Candidatus Muirbacterium halophilum]MCK9475316.1 VWA domain-containing protein [Candidatus Muirbacterium halophilum]
MKKTLLTVMIFMILAIFSFSLDLKMEKLKTERYPLINPVVNVSEDGISLKDVQAEDLEVWVKTQVPFSMENMQLPLSIIMILDKSGSMEQDIKRLKAASGRFLEILKPVDEIALVAFDRKTYFLQDFTTNRELIKKSYENINAKGATRLYDTIVDSINKYAKPGAYTTVVLFTDGKDEAYEGSLPISKNVPEDIISLCEKNEIPLHIIGFGDRINKDVLKLLADKTHGNFYHAPKSKEFARIYENIARSFNGLVNITYTTPFKDWYAGKRFVEVKVNKDNKQANDEKHYIRSESQHIVSNVADNKDVLSLLEKVPRVTIVASDRQNRLIDGSFKILVNGKVVDNGSIEKGTAVFNLKNYFFDENFRRIPENYEKLHKKTVLFTPDLKMRVFTTEADNQFVPMKIELISFDNKKEYSFTTTFDGIGNELVTQDIVEGVYNLRVFNNSNIIHKDIIKINKDYRLTKDYRFGRITLKSDGSLFGDRENTSLSISILNEHTGEFVYKNEKLYKVTGGKSYLFLPPGRYAVSLENSKKEDQYLKGSLEFEAVILGGENIRTNIKREDIN